jgi:hypothetical protein
MRTQVRPPRNRRRGGLDDRPDEPEPAPAGTHHVHRRPRRPITRGRLALAGIVAGLAATVVATIVAGFLPALLQPFAGEEAGPGRHDAAGIGRRVSVDVATPVTASVRDWVLANLEPSTALLVPDEIAGDLARHGHQAGRLILYGVDRSAADWPCCRFLVTVGGAAESSAQTLPPQLRRVAERSRLLAVFVAGNRRAEIREIFPGDPKAAEAALAADRTVRQDLAVHLAGNPRLGLDPAARATLLAGEVDTRVLVTLAGVIRRHAITVAAFPAHPGEATIGVPRRSVHISSIDGRAVHPDTAGTLDVQRFLLKQAPPYRPDARPIVRDGSARLLTICFRAPSPVGLRVPPRA